MHVDHGISMFCKVDTVVDSPYHLNFVTEVNFINWGIGIYKSGPKRSRAYVSSKTLEESCYFVFGRKLETSKFSYKKHSLSWYCGDHRGQVK